MYIPDWFPAHVISLLNHSDAETGTLRENYRQTFNISRTKFQKLNVSRLVLQLSLPNQLKPDTKSRMKMRVIKNLIGY